MVVPKRKAESDAVREPAAASASKKPHPRRITPQKAATAVEQTDDENLQDEDEDDEEM